jgi:hypothetical protein
VTTPLASGTKDRAITVPLVLPLSWLDRLNSLAAERGIGRSALIRSAIEAGLFKTPSMTTMHANDLRKE